MPVSSCSDAPMTAAPRAGAPIAETPKARDPLNNWRGQSGAVGRRWPSEAALRAISALIPPAARGGAAALDAGCGSGRHALALAELGFGRVIATDADPQMTELARAAALGSGATLETHVAPLDQQPLPDGTIDLALSWGTLFQLGGRAAAVAALRELRRIIRPGGVVIADWRTDDDSLRTFASDVVEPGTIRLGPGAPAGLAGMVYSFWSADEVSALCAASGLTVVWLERCEIRDVRKDRRFAWWVTGARPSTS